MSVIGFLLVVMMCSSVSGRSMPRPSEIKLCGTAPNGLPLFCGYDYSKLTTNQVPSRKRGMEESFEANGPKRDPDSKYIEKIVYVKEILDIPPPLPSSFFDPCFSTRATVGYLTRAQTNTIVADWKDLMWHEYGYNVSQAVYDPTTCSYFTQDYYAFPLDVGTDDYSDIVEYWKTKPTATIFNNWFGRYTGMYVMPLREGVVFPGGENKGRNFTTHKGIIDGLQGYLRLDADWTRPINRKLYECSTPSTAVEVQDIYGFYDSIITFRCFDYDNGTPCAMQESNTYYNTTGVQDEYKISVMTCPSYVF